VTRSSSDWIQGADGGWIKARVPQTRGLSRQHNHFLKSIFKGAATTVITQCNTDPIHARYERRCCGCGRTRRSTTPDEEVHRQSRAKAKRWLDRESRREGSSSSTQPRRVFACHALRGRGGEHPCFSWPTAHSPEVLLISYAPPKNQTKRWPTEAQMEGWFPRYRGEHTRQRIAMQWNCAQTESPDRAARNSSAAAQAELREQRLNSRPSSWNESRRPDRRICGDGGSTSCAPTLWKEK